MIKFAPPTLVEFLEEKPTVGKWLIKDFLPADSVTVVTGPPKRSMKTYWTMLCSLCLASGRSYDKLKVSEPKPVMFVEQEGSRTDFQNRFRWLCNGIGVKPEEVGDRMRIAHRSGVKLDNADWIKSIQISCEEYGTELIVFDPLAMCHLGDENNTRDMTLFIEALNVIRGLNRSCVVVHHVNGKDSGWDRSRDIDDQFRGSSVLPGYYDAHHAMRMGREGFEISLTMRFKEGPEQEYDLSWDIDQDKEVANLTIL